MIHYNRWKYEVCMYNCKEYYYNVKSKYFVKINLNNFNFLDFNITCPICIESLSNKSNIIVDTACGHYICSNCWNNPYISLNKYKKLIFVHGLDGNCSSCNCDINDTNYPTYFNSIDNNDIPYCINCSKECKIFKSYSQKHKRCCFYNLFKYC